MDREIRHVVQALESLKSVALELERIRGLFEIAGQDEYNVLAVIDFYQRELFDAENRLRVVRNLLHDEGCSCECPCHGFEHGDDCTRSTKCLACRVLKAMSYKVMR